MTKEDWRKFGEIQYIRGRLDEMFKIDKMIDMDMHSMRLINARIAKYFDKLEKQDFRSYVLCISSMIKVGMEIHFLEMFQTQYSQIDYRSEIELFQFKDSKITTLLIDLVSGYQLVF